MTWLANLNPFSWILILGVLLNLTFLFLTLRKKEDRKNWSRICLSVIFGAFTFLLVDSLARTQFSVSLLGLAITADYLIAPMLYFYSLSLVAPKKLRTMPKWPHFLAFWATFLAAILLVFSFGPNWLFLIGENNEKFVFYWAATKPIFYVGYLLASLRVFSKAQPKIRARDKRAFKNTVIIFRGFLFLVVVLFTEFLLFNLGFEWLPLPDKISFIVAALTIYLTGFFALRNDRFFTGFNLKRKRPDSIGAKTLLNFLEKEKPFLEPDLTLKRLSNLMGLSEPALTSILADDLATNFYALLNNYRIREFKTLAKDPKNTKRPVLNLAYDAGFNSKAVFYRVFKEQEGCTPREYKNKL